ncbi:MAG: GNAT family N-acetyltransferase [Planctomycetota bacterium]
MRYESYRSVDRPALIQLWNDVFREQRHFLPMTEQLWRERIERTLDSGGGDTAFEPELLRVAHDDQQVVGFAHGGEWHEAWCRALFPGTRLRAAGYLACIAVTPAARRSGVGRGLVASLRATIDQRAGASVPLRVDGRMFNPYYGNGRAPTAPLWGTPEGLAVAAGDAAMRAFLADCGFLEHQTAVALAATPSAGRASQRCKIEVRDDCSPVLGTDLTEPFLETNRSRTWLALRDGEAAGALVAYPLSGRVWGIHSLQVHPDHEGSGLGSALISRLLSDLVEVADSVEVLTLPEESPGALHLYSKAGFQPVADWLIFT